MYSSKYILQPQFLITLHISGVGLLWWWCILLRSQPPYFCQEWAVMWNLICCSPLHKAVINENLTIAKRQCAVLCGRKSKLDVYNFDKEVCMYVCMYVFWHIVLLKYCIFNWILRACRFPKFKQKMCIYICIYKYKFCVCVWVCVRACEWVSVC
jgi:hypothetical protein